MASMEVKANPVHTSLVSDTRNAIFWKSSEDSNHAKSVDFKDNHKEEDVDFAETTRQKPVSSGVFSSYAVDTGPNLDERPELKLLMKKLNKMYHFCNYVSTAVVLALVVLNVTAGVLIKNDEESIISGTSLADLSKREIGLTQMAINARLISFNISPESNALFIKNFDWFRELVANSQAKVWDEIDQTQSVNYRLFMTQEMVHTWQMMDKTVVLVQRTLIDAVQFILDNVLLTQANSLLSNSNFTETKVNIYNIFRNSIGETFRASVTAQAKFAVCQKTILSSMISNYYVYLLCAIMVVIVGAVLLIPAQFLMQKTSSIISRCVQCHSIEVFIEQKRKVVDRLKERYDIELEYSIEEPFRGEKVQIRLYNPLVLMGTTVSVFLGVCMVFYLLLYFQTFMPLASTMELIPVLMNTEANRNIAVSEAFAWMNEDLVLETDQSLSFFIPEVSLFPYPHMDFYRSIETLRKCSNELMKSYLDGFHMTENHFEIVYDTSTEGKSLYFRYGRRTAIKELVFDMNFCMDGSNEECTSLLASTLYPLQTELANSSASLIQMFADDAARQADSQIRIIMSLLVTFSVCLVLFLVFGLTNMNRETYKRAKIFWKLCNILPPLECATRKFSALKIEEVE